MQTTAEAGATSSQGGLEGMVIGDTRLSAVFGDAGRLVIAGRELRELSGRVSFAELCDDLWSLALSERPGASTASQLGQARVLAYERLPHLGDVLASANGMDALRAAIAHTPPPPDGLSARAQLVGAVAVYSAAWVRAQRGASPLAPDPKLEHAADWLRMAHGKTPSAAAAHALDAYLVTVMDHGLNASTFAARVVASTQSDPVSAITAALGALKGPLHGGAPGPVLDMLDAIGEAGRARDWLRAHLAAGNRIMGMGHRVYRVRDPRAAALEAVVERLDAEVGDARVKQRLTLARAAEQEAQTLLAERYPSRQLRANVEFFTAILLESLQVPREAFTMVFACGRVAGWCAHYLEQQRTGRLIRPRARYVGHLPEPN